jgi:spoIIIJ-associated protein
MEKAMEQEVIVTASTIEDAIEEALEQLGAQKEDVEIEIIEEPVKKLFGETIEAKVRVALLAETAETSENDEEELEDEDEGEEDGEVQDDDESEEESEDEGEEGGEDEDESEGEEAPAENERNFNKVSVQLTEDELDTIADTAIEVVTEFLGYFNLEDSGIDEYEGEEGELIFDIVGENLAVLIGRHGKTLDSLQFLVSSIVGKKTGYRHPIIIDVEGYKNRRKQKLISIAKSSATRAIRQKHEVSLRPMTPYERRIIHVALKGDKRITTASEGTEPTRHVVIRPI